MRRLIPLKEDLRVEYWSQNSCNWPGYVLYLKSCSFCCIERLKSFCASNYRIPFLGRSLIFVKALIVILATRDTILTHVYIGTWQSPPNQVRHAVKAALQQGYRHIDTALAYGNEAEVGQGIKDSGVPREDIWVTTKLDNTWHHRVQDGIATSLKDLDIGYVDLYLIVSRSESMQRSGSVANSFPALAQLH